MLARGRMSTFGGPNDEGVSSSEGLALIEPVDLFDWWFKRLFLNAQPVNTTGLARRLNPDAFYIAMRWDHYGIGRDQARRAVFRLTNPNSKVTSTPSALTTVRTVFAQGADWGPNARTNRVCDMSPGCAKALGLTTDKEVIVELIDVKGAMA